MTGLVVAGVAAAVLAWPSAPRPRRRLRRVVDRPGAPAPRSRRWPVPVAAAGLGLSVTVHALPWWLLPVAGALMLLTVRGRRQPEVAPAELALAVDLMASCLRAGSTIAAATSAATAAAGPVLRAWLATVTAHLGAGCDPAEAWSPWLADARLAPVARVFVRSAGSGAAPAAELTRIAARIRAAEVADVQRRLAQVSVWIVLPMGVCFLPAFVLVGVVPLVLGLLHGLR